MGNKRFWILDFGFWIEELIGNLNRKSLNRKFKIGWEWGIGNVTGQM